MRPSPARRSSSLRRALVGVVVGVLLFSGAPLAAWSAPTPTPTPSGSVEAQDAETPPAKETPSDDESASDDPSDKPSESATPEDTESPSESTDPSESPSPSTSETTSPSPDPDGSTASEKAAARDGDIGALVVPPPPAGTAVVSVRVGGDRTGTGANSVSALQGVVLGLYTLETGGTNAAPNHTSDVDGDCNFIVPATNLPGRFWVRQVSPPTGWYDNTALRTGTSSATPR